MRLWASLLTGLSAALAVGLLTGVAPRLGRGGRRRPQVSPQQLWLVQAGSDLTPRQFWFGSAAIGLVTAVLVVAVTGAPAVALVPAAAVAMLPRAYYARERSRRLRALQEAWPDGIRELLAGITAGRSLHQTVAALAEAGPPTLREAFARYPTLARVLGVVPALEVVKEELADPTSDRVIEVLILAHERGGALVGDILRDLAEATTRDLRVLEEIQTDSLEQRINARAVFVLPWLVLLALTAQDGFFRDFYRGPGGIVVVLIGALLSVAGIAVVTRLSREPVEQRVLGAAAPAALHDGSSDG